MFHSLVRDRSFDRKSCFSFIGSRAIVSGPAGGVVGYAITTYHRETDLPVIGFDMGGRSSTHYAKKCEKNSKTTWAKNGNVCR